MKLSKQAKISLGLGAIGLLIAYGSKKYNDYSEVLNNLQFYISSISKLKIVGNKLFFDISIMFTNPSKIDFSINSFGLVTVKKVKVFRDKIFIGEANSEITKIEILANSKTELQGITIATDYLNLLAEMTNFEEFTNLSKYKLEILVEALGQTFIIEQPMI